MYCAPKQNAQRATAVDEKSDRGLMIGGHGIASHDGIKKAGLKFAADQSRALCIQALCAGNQGCILMQVVVPELAADRCLPPISSIRAFLSLAVFSRVAPEMIPILRASG